MNIVDIDGKNYRLPSTLTAFQRDMYVHLIDWKWRNITEKPARKGDFEYDAILPEQYHLGARSPLIHQSIQDALSDHRTKNPFRTHLHFYHMASSQAANINLFLPVLLAPNVNAIMGAIKHDFASLATDQLDQGYCIEFWGGNYTGEPPSGNAGPLGDKGPMSGTDCDIAIAYRNHQGELCLWLIEHKLTEKEFTCCGGSKSKGRQPRHDCRKSFMDLLDDKSACYYHAAKGFKYWDITGANRAFFPNHTAHDECPFRGGMNQLWRNQLIALAIEQDPRQPYKHAFFSVVHHPENPHLEKTIKSYTRLIADNPRFYAFTSADVIDAARTHGGEGLAEWIDWYARLYNLAQKRAVSS